MDGQDNTSQSNAMSSEELERTMRTLEPMYDLVRVVDPSATQGRAITADGTLDLPHRCYDVLNKGRRCKNCISARTIAGKCSVSKFEVVGEDAFFISTRYVEENGKPRSIELVKHLGSSTLLQSDPSQDVHNLRDLVTNDDNTRYADKIDGVMSREYLSEGIDELTARRVALLHVLGLREQGVCERARRRILEKVAQSVLQHTRATDTLVRYDNTTFAILFEGIPAELFRMRLQQIRANALQALEHDEDAQSVDIAIGGVAREGKVRELLELAANALSASQSGTRRLVILMDEGPDDHAPVPAKDETVGTPALGQHQSTYDALTRLPLAGPFRRALQERIEHLQPGDDPMRVIHMDIENFKAFNRAYGLPTGDVLLVQLANAIREVFSHDLATRSGVDMFVVATRRSDAHERIEQLRERLAAERRNVALELKAGMCEINRPEADAHEAMDHAKIACDSIKGKYDQTLCLFDRGLEQQLSLRDHIVKTLDEAIASKYIRPYYQIVVRSFTGKACGMEALARWEDPDFGCISPGDVIPILEQHHLIHKHDIHMVRCVCQTLRARMDAKLPVVPISVNLSRLDFELCNIFDEVQAALEAYDIEPRLLEIEVTESMLDDSNDVFKPQIERFRNAGHEIWMDDFGSGYSSLNLLKDYKFDVLKIDMAFLRGLESNQNSKQILTSIVDMAKRIGVRTLAEGVENQAHLDFLKDIGCEMIQGYLFSHPSPSEPDRLGTDLDAETPGERTYCETVGRINLLSPQPFEEMVASDVNTTRGMPFAVVEKDGDELRYLAMNGAYRCRVMSTGNNADDPVPRERLDESALLVATLGSTSAYLVVAR